MILKKTKTKLFAVLTAFTMAVAVTLSLRETISVNADIPGTTYCKYDYQTKKITEYTLSSIPEYDIISSRSAMSDDPRDDAPLENEMVKISVTRNNGYSFMGTGFIIGEHEIMTAAHVILEDSPVFAPKITIEPQVIKNNNASFTAVSAHYPKIHVDGAKGHDYAIITVKEDLSSYGKALLGVPTDQAINNHMYIHCLGYGGDGVLKISNGYILKSSEGGTELNPDLYIAAGTSGGPVYVETDYGNADGTNRVTYKTVIGVVSGRNIDKEWVAPQIRPEILKFAYNNPNLE